MSADPYGGPPPLGGGGGGGVSRSSRSPQPPSTTTLQQLHRTPSTTTISTIVLNSKPIQLVIALLQVSRRTELWSRIPRTGEARGIAENYFFNYFALMCVYTMRSLFLLFHCNVVKYICRLSSRDDCACARCV